MYKCDPGFVINSLWERREPTPAFSPRIGEVQGSFDCTGQSSAKSIGVNEFYQGDRKKKEKKKKCQNEQMNRTPIHRQAGPEMMYLAVLRGVRTESMRLVIGHIPLTPTQMIIHTRCTARIGLRIQ